MIVERFPRQTANEALVSAKYSLKRDLEELAQMSGRLREYLLGDALYMPVGGGFLRGGGAPQLTIGAILLRRRRITLLRAALEAAGQAKLDAVIAQLDDAQREWTLHYEKKLRQEAGSRLTLLHGFIRDCGERPCDCAAAYPVEAMRRSIMQEILLALDEFAYDQSDILPKLEHCDAGLRVLLKRCDFIWSAELQPVYPRATFWWLYGKPAAR